MPIRLIEVDSDYDSGFDPDPISLPASFKIKFPELFLAWTAHRETLDSSGFATIGFGWQGAGAASVGMIISNFFGLVDDSYAYPSSSLCSARADRAGVGAPPLENISVSNLTPGGCGKITLSDGYPRDKLTAIMAYGSGPGNRFDFVLPATSSGTASVTDVFFEPLALLLHWAAGGFDATNHLSIGAASADAQWSLSLCTEGFNSFPGAGRKRVFKDDMAFVHIEPDGLVYAGVTITSMDASGFTYDWFNDTGVDIGIDGIAFIPSSGEMAVGVGTQDDAAIDAGFEPQAVLYMSSQCDDTSVQDGCYLSIGGGSANNGLQRAASMAGGGGGGNWGAYTDGVIRFQEDDGTDLGQATHVLTADGADLTWADSDSGDRLFGWVAFGDSAGGLCGKPQVVRYH